MMKKILAAAFLFLIAPPLFAGEISDKDVIRTSHTVGATAGAILFTSATIRFEGVLVSSPSPGSILAIFSSTSSTFNTAIATQIQVNADYQAVNTNPSSVDLWGVENDSYTYIHHPGASNMTIFFRCKDSIYQPYNASTGEGYNGICPGLPWSGVRGKPLGQR